MHSKLSWRHAAITVCKSRDPPGTDAWRRQVCASVYVLGSLTHSASLCTAQYSQQRGCTIPSPAVEGSKSPEGAGCQCPSMAQQSISHFSKSPGASLEYVSQLSFGVTTSIPSSKDQKDLTYMFTIIQANKSQSGLIELYRAMPV